MSKCNFVFCSDRVCMAEQWHAACRAYKILRPTSHLTIKVKERQSGGRRAAAAPQPVAAE